MRSSADEQSSKGSIAMLYRAHIGDAQGLAYLMTGSKVDAEDIAQEAFIRSISRLHHLRSPDAFSAYLRRSVVNEAISQHRRRKLLRNLALRRTVDRDLEDVVLTRQALRVALGSLSLKERAAVVLHFYLDLPTAQVAELLRCPPGTVRSLTSRAVAKLRVILEEEEE